MYVKGDVPIVSKDLRARAIPYLQEGKHRIAEMHFFAYLKEDVHMTTICPKKLEIPFRVCCTLHQTHFPEQSNAHPQSNNGQSYLSVPLVCSEESAALLKTYLGAQDPHGFDRVSDSAMYARLEPMTMTTCDLNTMTTTLTLNHDLTTTMKPESLTLQPRAQQQIPVQTQPSQTLALQELEIEKVAAHSPESEQERKTREMKAIQREKQKHRQREYRARLRLRKLQEIERLKELQKCQQHPELLAQMQVLPSPLQDYHLKQQEECKQYDPTQHQLLQKRQLDDPTHERETKRFHPEMPNVTCSHRNALPSLSSQTQQLQLPPLMKILDSDLTTTHYLDYDDNSTDDSELLPCTC